MLHAEVGAIPLAPGRLVQRPRQALRLPPRDVEKGEAVADRRVPVLQLLEMFGGGRAAPPDVRVVTLDVVRTGGGPVRHDEDPDGRFSHSTLSVRRPRGRGRRAGGAPPRPTPGGRRGRG